MMYRRRSAYTLLEVMLSLAISVMLLAAVYSAVGIQLRQSQAGRDLVEQTTLARAILGRMSTDVSAAITLGDPARFRRASAQSGASGMTDPSGAATGTSGTGTGTGTGTSTGTGTGTATGTGTETTTDTTGMTTDTATTNSTSLVQLPLGVLGSASELHLFVSKVPGEVFANTTGESGQLTCDLRRISYWIGEGDIGLCRKEARLITSEEATNTAIPTGDAEASVLASEVKSLEISYFDGSSWVESWDSTEVGSDSITPKGSPRAIALKIGVILPGKPGTGGDPQMKYYRHVIFVPTAGGTPLDTSGSGTTTP